MRCGTGGDEFAHDARGVIYGNGETNPDRTALRISGVAKTAQRRRCRIHSDELAVDVNQSAARVARVERGVRLNGVKRRGLSVAVGGIVDRTVERTDDANGD